MKLHGDTVCFRKYTSLVSALAFFIKNFLSDRMFSVRVSGASSVPFPQEEGVPQGSVLSSTLFIIAINDITHNIPLGVSATLYVDDLSISLVPATSLQLKDFSRPLSTEFEHWSSNHGFKMCMANTVMVDFCQKRTRPDQIRLFLVDELIRTEDCKFFWPFDKRLNWKLHIRNLTA